MRTKLIFLPFVLFLVVAPSMGQEKESPARLNLFLKEEYSLAKTPALYFVFDLNGKSIVLKSKGMVIQDWKIKSVHSWGGQPLLKTLTLIKKSTLFPPKRKKIKPGEAEEGGTFELEALELKDMPSTYALYLSEGIYIYIRSNPKKFISGVRSIGHFFNWYLWVPLRNLGHKLRKRPFIAIDIKLADKEESQALYWALAEGTKGFVYNP
jgi:hypothetical protein